MTPPDFIQYWSAYNLLITQQNPYDPQSMYLVQREIFSNSPEIIMMWNPPWVALILSPLLCMDYQTAYSVFTVFNSLLFVLGSILIFSCISSQNDRSQRLLVIALAAINYPLLDCIRSGQLGVFLFFGSALVLFGISQNSFRIGGVGVAILSAKPHLILPYLVVAGFFNENIRRCFLHGCIYIAFLFALGELFAPGSSAEWIHALFNQPHHPMVTPILEWRSDSFSGFLRGLSFNFTNTRADWLMSVLPLFGLLITFWYGKKKGIDFSSLVFFLIPISLLFAPYGWFSDLVLLSAGQIVIAYRAINKKIPMVILWITLGFQVGFFALSALFTGVHQWSSLYPILFLITQIFFWDLKPPSDQKLS